VSDEARPEAAGRSAPITVLGAGSWGTALAIQLARSGRTTRLWGRNAGQLRAMEQDRRNARYLPGAAFPESLIVAADLAAALRGAQDVLVAVPSRAFRAVLEEVAPLLEPQSRVAWATKGFELDSGKLPHQVAHEVLGRQRHVAVLSGPTFAREVGAGLPTAMTIASEDDSFAGALAQDLSSSNFRAYTSNDIVGVEVGGAVKNVLAVGAGLSDGLGFGANTRIALITRGLVEMTRLGVTLGAQRETFMGLAGLGDLVLSCTDDQSRNRRFGLLLARGLAPEQALAEIGQAVEGYVAARAVRSVASKLKVDMPLSAGIYSVLYENLPAREIVRGLMSRPIKPETQ
jgi:glycerol-3-phosphate dehydrogenase (NAD(P)+)